MLYIVAFSTTILLVQLAPKRPKSTWFFHRLKVVFCMAYDILHGTPSHWSSRNRPCWIIIWMKSWNLVQKKNGSDNEIGATLVIWCDMNKRKIQVVVFWKKNIQKHQKYWVSLHQTFGSLPGFQRKTASKKHHSAVQETQIHQMHQIRHDPIVRWPDPPEGFWQLRTGLYRGYRGNIWPLWWRHWVNVWWQRGI